MKVISKNNGGIIVIELQPEEGIDNVGACTWMRVCFNDMCDKLGIDRDVHNTAHGLEGLSIYSLRHTSDTISNLNGSNVVATAMKMGHKAIRTENVYTHPTEEGLSQVVNPSEVVLEGYKKETKKEADPEYQLYLKLKEKYSQS